MIIASLPSLLAGLLAAAPVTSAPPTSPAITAERLRGHVRFLSSDLLEGRGPASRGDMLTQQYLAAQMEMAGLQPGAPDGTFFQPFDIVGITTHVPETVTVSGGTSTLALKRHDEFVGVSGVAAPEARVEDAEIVFAGYGIVAPEYRWNDFKDVDLKGKVLLVMNNDPEKDPALFAGKTRLYYGRWDYKYETGAKTGAAAVIIIHTTPSAGYPWQVVQTSWSGEQFELPKSGEPTLQVQAWVTEDAARRLVQLGGNDLDALRAAAEAREFKPVPLGVRLSVALRNDVSRKKTANVIGRLPGSDAALAAEAVVYTAHHDHLGLKDGAKPGEDAIYNGAYDNGTGVAALLTIANAMGTMQPRPKRSVLFAAVAAEEQGLLGSEYLASHLPLPAGRLAVDINMDGINILGPTRDLEMIGLGKSSVDDVVLDLVKRQGRTLLPDQMPDRGYFYRSDQFNFAKAGVPAAYFKSGDDVIGKPAGWGQEQKEKFEKTDYHQPSDELKPDWNFEGAVQDVSLFFQLGVAIANAPEMPRWRKGDEFEAARLKALSDVR
jgi:Zn-dependent M28 family amino/carboxypeptidase